MNRFPRTLFGQLLLALVSGMAMALTLTIWFSMQDRAQQFERFAGTHTAQRVASLVALLNESSAVERRRLVKAFNVGLRRQIRLDEPWRAPIHGSSPQADNFADLLHQELGSTVPVQVLFLGESSRMGDAHNRDRGNGHAGLRAVIQVRLTDGAVVTLNQSIPVAHSEETYLVIGSLVFMGAIIALLTAWVVRRLTSPLRALANAASGLALNLDQPPVPETGSVEVARAASAFNAMQKELKHLLETRAQALAGVSHDLRLPLTRLRLRAEQIKDISLKADIDHDLSEMDAMIATTLDFLRAGLSSETPVRLNLGALIAAVAAEMEDIGAIVCLSRSAPAQIMARPLALRRCLSNLMDNARRYGGGQIGVGLRCTDTTVFIRIDDRGPGIPDEQKERVFEPYVRLDESRSRDTGGTGLGLTIARAIACQEGGDIRLETRAGGGLSVILSLPAN